MSTNIHSVISTASGLKSLDRISISELHKSTNAQYVGI